MAAKIKILNSNGEALSYGAVIVCVKDFSAPPVALYAGDKVRFVGSTFPQLSVDPLVIVDFIDGIPTKARVYLDLETFNLTWSYV